MKAFAVLFGSSMLALAGAAQAQTAETRAASAQTPPAAQVPGDEATPEQAAGQGNAGDIVVTANRREERLQNVPIAVSVVDGNQLVRQNITTVENLQRAAPALSLAGPAGYGALSIRGIGALSYSRSSESSVGVVVDNVALANTSIVPPLLFDIARIEVLEGPQSTLFGRNSSAGVVNIVTNAPDPARQEGIAHVDIGSRDQVIAQVAANAPLSANSALRMAASFSRDPQTNRDLYSDTDLERESKAVRGRFLWEPTTALTVNLSGDYTRIDVNGGAPWSVVSSTPGSLLTQRLAACGVTVGPENTSACINDDYRLKTTVYGFSGQVDLDLGGATLTSITAYRKADQDNIADVDSTTANRIFQTVYDRARNISQELRVTTPTGRFIEAVGGLYYFNGHTSNQTTQVGQLLADLPLINACPFPVAALCNLTLGQTRPTDTQSESYAAFGQATIHATSALRFVLGARVGHERVAAQASASVPVTGAAAVFAGLPAIDSRTTDTYFSYRAGAQYDIVRNLMVFATYTRGYKGPAVNDQGAGIAGVSLIVRPEIPKSAEVGFKSTFAGGRAALNATAFYTKVENFQAQYVDTSTGTPLYVFGNAPALTVKGVTANLFGRPAAGLTINLGANYTARRYGAGYRQPNFAGTIVDVSGNLPGGRFKGTASGEYETRLSDRVSAFVQADLVYSPKRYSNDAGDEILAFDSAAIVGGRIGLRTSDGRYGIAAYVRNLFDTFRATAKFATPLAAQQLDPASASQISGPEARRVIGLSLDARF